MLSFGGELITGAGFKAGNRLGAPLASLGRGRKLTFKDLNRHTMRRSTKIHAGTVAREDGKRTNGIDRRL